MRDLVDSTSGFMRENDQASSGRNATNIRAAQRAHTVDTHAISLINERCLSAQNRQVTSESFEAIENTS